MYLTAILWCLLLKFSITLPHPHTYTFIVIFYISLKWDVPQYSFTKSLMWPMALQLNWNLSSCHFHNCEIVVGIYLSSFCSSEMPCWTLVMGAIDKNKWTSNMMPENIIWFLTWEHSETLKLCFIKQPKMREVTQFQHRLSSRRCQCSSELKIGIYRVKNLMEPVSKFLLWERMRLSLLLVLHNFQERALWRI